MNYKQQQKKDQKEVEEYMDNFSKKELARMLVREKKRKNKYLHELREYKNRG